MFTLISMLSKNAGDLTDEELTEAATAIGGQSATGLFELFKTLRDAEPGVKVTDLLSTPAANDALRAVNERLRNQTDEDSGTLCRCPRCHFPFIA